MNIGDSIDFYVFGVPETGIIVSKNNDKTLTIDVRGYKIPKY
jgi:hypothetical protein